MHVRNERSALEATAPVERYPSLTGLRLVAATLVVVSHTTAMMVKLPNGEPVFTLNFASVGMSLFFVLSGFVICTNYSETVSTLAGIWNFFAARFARLYPLYLVFLGFDLLMKVGFHQFRLERLESLPFYLTLTQSWLYFPVDGNSLIFQFGLVPQVTWSISTEWFFYFCFPFLCVFLSPLRGPKQIVGTIVGLCVASYAVVFAINCFADQIQRIAVERYGNIAATTPHEFYRWLAYFSPYTRIFEFALGALIAILVRALPPPTLRERHVGAALTMAALGVVAAIYVLFFALDIPRPVARLHQNFGFAPVLALIVYCCARYDTLVTRALSQRRVVLLGEASYSIYLAHMVILDSFRFEVPTITDPQIWIVVILQATIAFVAIVGVALVLWSAVEMPSRKFLRKVLFLPRHASIPELAASPPQQGLESRVKLSV